MSTAKQQPQAEATTKTVSLADVVSETLERGVEFTPFRETESIRLSESIVRNYLEVKTRSGKTASTADVHKFIMLCKARGLNPWLGDAYLVGYDSQDGPAFNLITSVQALYKRADSHPAYDGLESGLYVARDGDVHRVERQIAMRGEEIVGAWALVYRKDRAHPEPGEVDFGAYDTGRIRWKKDPAGMIVKCARAKALRAAFPQDLGGLYTADEMGDFERDTPERPQPRGNGRIKASSLDMRQTQPEATSEPETAEEPKQAPTDWRLFERDDDYRNAVEEGY